MNLNEYRNMRAEYAVYKKRNFVDGLVYSVLALYGEAGRLANKPKKHLRKLRTPGPVGRRQDNGLTPRHA